MCGIAGIVGNVGQGQALSHKKDLLYEMMWAGTFRGADSTGLALLPKSKGESVEIYKRALNGADFTQLNKTRKLVDRIWHSNGVLIHNRSATKATVSDGNAHPFQCEHIVLVHNGTIHNEREIAPTFKGQVDSAAICQAIAESSNIPETLGKIKGGFSLVWHDQRDGSVHFARNDQRPMYWLRSKDRSFMVFGSEWEMLWWLTSRRGMDMQPDMLSTVAMHWYKIPDPSKPEVFEKVPFFTAPLHTPRTKRDTGMRRGWVPNIGATGTSTTKDDTPVMRRLLNHTDRERAEELISWADFDGIPLDKVVLVKPLRWQGYQGAKHNRGMLVCRAAITGAEVVIHGIDADRYKELGKKERLAVWITNFSGSANVRSVTRGLTYVGVLHTPETQRQEVKLLTAKEVQEDSDEITVLEYLGPHGVLLSRKRWDELTSPGCAHCGDSPLPDANRALVWLDTPQSDFLCEGCWSHPNVRDEYKDFISNN